MFDIRDSCTCSKFYLVLTLSIVLLIFKVSGWFTRPFKKKYVSERSWSSELGLGWGYKFLLVKGGLSSRVAAIYTFEEPSNSSWKKITQPLSKHSYQLVVSLFICQILLNVYILYAKIHKVLVAFVQFEQTCDVTSCDTIIKISVTVLVWTFSYS